MTRNVSKITFSYALVGQFQPELNSHFSVSSLIKIILLWSLWSLVSTILFDPPKVSSIQHSSIHEL